MSPQHTVWYASFGSNLRRERFMHYLRGGTLAGQQIGHAGARNSQAPQRDLMSRIPHQLRFGGESKRWGGGVAFVDPEPGSGSAIVRMWQVTAEQFCDVAAQENGMAPGDLDVDVVAVEAAGWLDVTERWYGRVLFLGRTEGLPAFTFTSPVVRPPTAPSAAYASTILAGLAEMGVGPAEAADYLVAAPGADAWTQSQLRALT